MSFQTPITIAEAINKISDNRYLLPAIQREFVWSHEKIEWLFDSIMKQYPISSFLFWEVTEKTARGYKFYKFIHEYRERFKTHNEEISTNGLFSFQAILDGQQRLTSLYIGLKGSFAYKIHRKNWENNEKNIPTRKLYLNLSHELKDEEDGKSYNFKFLTNSETNDQRLYKDTNNNLWFKVGDILNFKNEEDLDTFVEELENTFARKSVRLLFRSIHEKKLINFFLEQSQEIEKALNIFIRVNSGGKPLNFSDLIMSFVVANWGKRDARKEIHGLVDAICEKGFTINKDLILKTFLYLYSRDIRFKVNNFSKVNAELFEQKWDKIRDCLLSCFDLVKSFGFDDYTLTSKNSILPICYWLYHQNIFNEYTTKVEFKNERNQIKKWLQISILKQIFGAQSDAVLSQIRRCFTDNVLDIKISSNIEDFPINLIFSYVNKDVSITEEFIENLLSVKYEDAQAFSILALLYPNLDYKNNSFHKDHLYPKKKWKELRNYYGDKYSDKEYNSIINLQMLDANENMSKQDIGLNEWIQKESINKDIQTFLSNHLLPNNIIFNIENFDDFYTKRKELLTTRLMDLLK